MLPVDSMAKATLDVRDVVLGHVPASVVAAAAFVGSRIDTASGVAALPE